MVALHQLFIAAPETHNDSGRMFNLINPVDLRFTPIPLREWIVEDWLPVGTVTGLYADGGIGKTLLAQQLMTACATGVPWCGREVTRCRSVGLFCEDNEAELHRRQDAMNRAMGLNFADLSDMRWISGVGKDCTLIDFDREKMRLTPALDELEAIARAESARLVVLDTAADLYGGEENQRRQVRQFIGKLTRLAIDLNAAVLLNAHPSRSGLSSGNIDGGSTAWNNSLRSRWSLERLPADTVVDGRVLTRRKSNYSSIGETIELQWVRGFLRPLAAPGTAAGPTDAATERAACEIVFLDLLANRYRKEMWVSYSSRAANYAPKEFAKASDRKGYGKKDFAAAMVRLLDAGRIKLEQYGRPSDLRQRLAIAKPDAEEPSTDTETPPGLDQEEPTQDPQTDPTQDAEEPQNEG